jgi:hypothetical protein
MCDHGFDKPALMTTLKAINAAIDGDFVYRRCAPLARLGH